MQLQWNTMDEVVREWLSPTGKFYFLFGCQRVHLLLFQFVSAKTIPALLNAPNSPITNMRDEQLYDV